MAYFYSLFGLFLLLAVGNTDLQRSPVSADNSRFYLEILALQLIDDDVEQQKFPSDLLDNNVLGRRNKCTRY